MLFSIVILLVVLVLLTRFYFGKKFSYWSNKNVNQFAPSIPFGSISNSLRQRYNFAVILVDFYNRMKAKGWQDGGLYLFTRPTYFPVDLEYIKYILSKDFQYFVDRGIYSNPDEPLTNHLFAAGGSMWRNLRTKLTPTFTSGKLKGMFPIFLECSEGLSRAIPTDEPVNIKELLGNFTTDVIGSCAFGLDCESFSAEDSQFRLKAQKVFVTTPFTRSVRFIALTFPQLAKKIGFKLFSAEVTNFYTSVIKETDAYRREKRIKRNDFFQLLIDLMDDNQLSMNEVTAQAFLFFLAGFETSSSTMTYVLYELAKHNDIQKKVREEITKILQKDKGEITYDNLKEMTYLRQVIDETLRKYPPAPFITRKCVENYRHPFKKDLVIEKGTMVFIPIMGIHYDAEYYPDPERFDPERFSEKNKKTRHQYAYMPFGEGPRMCIGLRFGLLQVTVGLVALLKKYEFKVNAKTQEPIIFDKESIALAAEGGIWLNVNKL